MANLLPLCFRTEPLRAGGDYSYLLAPRKVLDTALRAASFYWERPVWSRFGNGNDRAVVIEINDNPSIDHGLEDAILGRRTLLSWVAE